MGEQASERKRNSRGGGERGRWREREREGERERKGFAPSLPLSLATTGQFHTRD
jgi:hypothetical protein